MTRIALLIAALCLTAVLACSSFAVGQVGVQKGYPAKVTASSTKTVKKRPYKLKVKGRITLPVKLCVPGSKPGTGATNCVPIKCPPGVRNLRYCGKPSAAELCAGSLRITIRRGVKSVIRKTVKLTATCTYSARITIRKKLKKGTLKVSVRFLGNTVFNARSAKTVNTKLKA